MKIGDIATATRDELSDELADAGEYTGDWKTADMDDLRERVHGIIRGGVSWPAIIVERPHQRPGRAWVANSMQDFIDLATEEPIEAWATLESFINFYGPDETEWPDHLAGDLEADQFPLILHDGDRHNATLVNEFNISLEILRDDLHAVDILENPAEAQALIESNMHNVPRKEIRNCIIELGWGAAA